MTSGIYCYKDTLNDNRIVYIGKDTNIGKNKRHRDHYFKSNYNDQVINRVLQNNPQRYKYQVLIEGDFDNKILIGFEKRYIRLYRTYRPKTCWGFNFTLGGEGYSVPRDLNPRTKSFARIIKSSKKNKKQYWKIVYDCETMGEPKDKRFLETLILKYFDENGFLLGDFSQTKKKISEEIKEHKRKEISKSKKGRKIKPFVRIVKDGSQNGKQQWAIVYDNKKMGTSHYKDFLETLIPKYFNEKGFLLGDFSEIKKQISKEIKEHMSKKKSRSRNSSGYRNVTIKGDRYIYRYTKNGIRKTISAYLIEELREKVERQNLPWEKFA